MAFSIAPHFRNDPWAKALDALIGMDYTDETVEGSISAQRSFALEGLVGASGKVGLSFVHQLGSEPTMDDIYAYWMRLAQVGTFTEVRVISSETGFSGRWVLAGDGQDAMKQFHQEVTDHNTSHTQKRRAGPVPRQNPIDWLEHQMPSGVQTPFVQPSAELRMFLNAIYNQLGVKDIRTLGPQDAAAVIEAVKRMVAENR